MRRNKCGRRISCIPGELSLPGHSVAGIDPGERCEVHPRLRCVPEKEEREQLRHWRRNLPSRGQRDDRDCAEFAAGRRAADTNKPTVHFYSERAVSSFQRTELFVLRSTSRSYYKLIVTIKLWRRGGLQPLLLRRR